MMQENIDTEVRKAKISACVNIFIRLVLIFLWCTKFVQLVSNQFILNVFWSVALALAIQCLFLPYVTNIRIKEIKKGEIYEASKY